MAYYFLAFWGNLKEERGNPREKESLHYMVIGLNIATFPEKSKRKRSSLLFFDK
jgi:hypothetical protein